MRALLVLALLGGTALAAPATPDSTHFGSHSIVSVSRKTAYVMSGNKGASELVAIDVTTGKRRWTAKDAVKPIVLRGDKLVALDAAGGVIVLDAKTGATAKPCGAIAGVQAPFTDGLGVRQNAWGFDDGSALYLVSTRSTHYAGGVAPSPEMEARSRTRTESTVSLDLKACKATPAKPTLPIPPDPNGATIDIVTASGNTARVVRDLKAQTVTLAPATNAKTTIDLTEGDRTRTSISFSIDRRHVICANPMAGTLAMFDLDTGAVTHPKVHFPYVWLSLGKHILVGSGAVSAYDTTTGKSLWTIAERSTAYNGPYPPSAPR